MARTLTRDPELITATRTAWAIAPGLWLAGIGGGIVFPILPLLGLQAHLAPILIGFILAGNRITRVVSNPWVGSLVDRYGGKRLLGAGLVLEALVMGIYVVAVRSGAIGPLFLAGRLIWGPASALIFVSGQTLALNAGPARHRGRTTGIVRAAQSLGTPSGMVLGGILAGLYGDQTAFVVGAVAAAAAAAVAWAKVPDLRVQGGLPPRRWRDIFESLRDRRVDALAVLNFGSFFSVQGLLLATLVLVVAENRLFVAGFPPQAASGVLLAVLLGAGALATLGAGSLADRFRGRTSVALLGLTLMVPGFLLLAWDQTNVWSVAGSLLVVGGGMGMFNVPLLALLGDLVRPAQRGSAVGSFQLFGDLGGSLGPLVGTTAVAAWGTHIPYLLTTAVLLATVPVGLWLWRTERVGQRGPVASRS